MTAIQTIEHGLPFDEYVKRPGVSISRLKELRRSPLHFHHAMNVPRESEPLTLGRAAHCAVLEPERYELEFVAWTRKTSGGNSAPRNGQHWDAFHEEHAGMNIITEEQHAEATGMRDAIRANTDAMKYLRAGNAEVSMFWSVMGQQARGRIDWLNIDPSLGTTIVGVKSTQDCRLFQFGRQAARLAYHLQWAYYFDAWKTLTGEIPRMVEIVVESKPPHAVGVYVIPDEVLQLGAEEYLALLETLAECERAGKWPGPNVAEQVLILPSWVYGDEVGEIKYVDD